MKILLAYQSGAIDRNAPYINLLPTGLCYLHAVLLEAGHDSLLANFSAWPTIRIEKELATVTPDMVGISQWTHNRHTSMELASQCRRLYPDALIVMGGGHATFCYEDILFSGSPVDVVIRGEAESTLLDLASKSTAPALWHEIAGIAFRQKTGIIVTQPRTPLADLDSLPLPARYLDVSIGVDLDLQPEFIVTTRGCPSACHFCSSPAFWGRKVRFRSPYSIVEEISFIRQKYGLIYFSIRDDTFTADRSRVMEFCSLLMQHQPILWNCQSRVNAIDEELVIAMKRAGCECIQLGVESGSPRILQQLGKKIVPVQIERACSIIKQIGINLSIYLICDIPGETSEDAQQTVDLVQKIRPGDGYVSPLAYYPGTQLFSQAIASGELAATIFADSRDSALYASDLPHAADRLLRVISKSKRDQPKRFARQKELLGYCFTTNVIASEAYCQKGAYQAAEQELLEISVRQPDNPWGWFLLGELYRETRRHHKAAQCYEMVLKLVPQHQPSKAALMK